MVDKIPPAAGVHRPVIVAYREGVSGTSGHFGRRRTEPVTSVTTAPAGRSDDLADRQRRYLIMMGIRVLCLPLAIITEGWLRWVFIAGAIVLPYVAVVIANVSRQPARGSVAAVPPVARKELPPGRISKDRIEP